MKPACRFIGIGSPFGADQLGWESLDQIQTIYQDNEKFEFLKLDRPGSDLIRHLQNIDQVILIDAIQSGIQAGDPISLSIDDIKTNPALTSSHDFSLAETLTMAATLKKLPNDLLIIGIEAGNNIQEIPKINMNKLRQILDDFILVNKI